MSYAPTHRGILDVGSVQIVQLVYVTFRFVVVLTITLFRILFSFFLIFPLLLDCSLCMLMIDHRGLFGGSRYLHSPVTSWP